MAKAKAVVELTKAEIIGALTEAARKHIEAEKGRISGGGSEVRFQIDGDEDCDGDVSGASVEFQWTGH